VIGIFLKPMYPIAHRSAMMTMAGSGCLIDHAETLIAITRSICEPTEAAFSASAPLVQSVAASGGKSSGSRGKSDARVLPLSRRTTLA
jgi:hypothetical protein